MTITLYLTSFLEPENFGPGDLIGICRSSPPEKFKTVGVFEEFTPSLDLLNTYQQNKFADKNSGAQFQAGFEAQLEKFVKELEQQALEEGIDVKEILPFEDGDTLVSWERSNYSNYRATLIPFLERLGYRVVAPPTNSP